MRKYQQRITFIVENFIFINISLKKCSLRGYSFFKENQLNLYQSTRIQSMENLLSIDLRVKFRSKIIDIRATSKSCFFCKRSISFISRRCPCSPKVEINAWKQTLLFCSLTHFKQSKMSGKSRFNNCINFVCSTSYNNFSKKRFFVFIT